MDLFRSGLCTVLPCPRYDIFMRTDVPTIMRKLDFKRGNGNTENHRSKCPGDGWSFADPEMWRGEGVKDLRVKKLREWAAEETVKLTKGSEQLGAEERARDLRTLKVLGYVARQSPSKSELFIDLNKAIF